MINAYLPLSPEAPDTCAHFISGVGTQTSQERLLQHYQSALPNDDQRQNQVQRKLFLTLEQPWVGQVTQEGEPYAEAAAPCEIGDLRLWRSDIRS